MEDEGKSIPLDFLIDLCREAIIGFKLNGVTITGGEPLLQASELALFIKKMCECTEDILLFTGYTMTELIQKRDENINSIINELTVLVDGPYERENNANDILRGSTNQRIFILRDSFAPVYKAYISENQHIIDNFVADDGIIAVGIHPQSFLDKIREE